jgi:hypothetical protein
MGLFGPSEKQLNRQAHSKGQRDFSRSGGMPKSNPIEEFFHPSYAPPAGRDKPYKAGWDNAKKNHNKRR